MAIGQKFKIKMIRNINFKEAIEDSKGQRVTKGQYLLSTYCSLVALGGVTYFTLRVERRNVFRVDQYPTLNFFAATTVFVSNLQHLTATRLI